MGMHEFVWPGSCLDRGSLRVNCALCSCAVSMYLLQAFNSIATACASLPLAWLSSQPD